MTRASQQQQQQQPNRVNERKCKTANVFVHTHTSICFFYNCMCAGVIDIYVRFVKRIGDRHSKSVSFSTFSNNIILLFFQGIFSYTTSLLERVSEKES